MRYKKYARHSLNKTVVATKLVCRGKHVFVATNIITGNIIFAEKNIILSRQAYLCLNKRRAIKGMLVATKLYIVQELCESRGGRPGLSVLTSLLVSVDVKNY